MYLSSPGPQLLSELKRGTFPQVEAAPGQPGKAWWAECGFSAYFSLGPGPVFNDSPAADE